MPRGKVPSRSRAEALHLASALSRRARENPEMFPALVARYSEHADAEQGGDIGTWFTARPSDYPREVQVLAALREQAVSEPVDSLFGFEVLQRTHPVPRKQYAMAAVALVFDRNVAAGAPNSRRSVERLITQLGEQLKRDPSRLAEIQREYCCIEPFAFSEGPVYPEVAKIFDRMNIGEMMTTPVESGVQLILAKRLDRQPFPCNRRGSIRASASPRTRPQSRARWIGERLGSRLIRRSMS